MDVPLQTLAEYAERSYDKGNADKARGYDTSPPPKYHGKRTNKTGNTETRRWQSNIAGEENSTIGTRNEGYRNKMKPKQHDNQQ